MLSALKSFFKSPFESAHERKKFSTLAVLFGITIGVYWLLRPLKDSVFITMIGSDYLPMVKMLSVIVIVPLILIYSKLVDRFSRHVLMYGLSTFYAILAIIFALLILNPVTGIDNTVADPSRFLGWTFYLFVESFGSIMIALFWSFVADTTTPEAAKRGYATIVMGAQVGGIAGPLGGLYLTKWLGTSYAILFGVVVLCFLPLAVYYYMNHATKDQMKGFHGETKKPLEGKKAETGFLEGLRLLLTKPYLLGIFIVVAFFEIIVTILDFHFKSLAGGSYIGHELGIFMFKYAIATNFVALVCVLAGVNKLGVKLGLGRTLMLLPIIVAIAMITLSFHTTLAFAFGIMVFCKGINYALNQPAKEQLYIPTTKETKYKAKAWIDMFGSRSSKGLGSVINGTKKALGANGFIWFSLIVSLGLIGIWLAAAVFLGKTHAQAIKEDRPVC